MKITYKKYNTYINDKMVDESKHQELEDTYINMYKIFEKMENANSVEMFTLVKDLEDTEFKMQDLFGFKHDRNYHRYWLDSPGCICPHMDNGENYGTPYRIIVLDCPVHGEKVTNIGKREEKLKRIIEDDNSSI